MKILARALARAHMQHGETAGVGIAFRARNGVKYLAVDHIDPASSAAMNGGVRNVSTNDWHGAHMKRLMFTREHTHTE